MTDAIRPLIAGNWKMNGLKGSLGEFEAMLAGAAGVVGKTDLLVCPPATLIASFAEKVRGATAFAVGAQDCHPKASGAHTGDISAEMLADARRHGRDRRPFRAPCRPRRKRRSVVRQKAEAAWRAGFDRHRLHRRDPGIKRERRAVPWISCGGQL